MRYSAMSSDALIMRTIENTICSTISHIPNKQRVHFSQHPISAIGRQEMLYVRFLVQTNFDAVIVYLKMDQLVGLGNQFVVYVKSKSHPTVDEHDYMTNGQAIRKTKHGLKMFIPKGILKKGYGYLGFSTGKYYILVYMYIGIFKFLRYYTEHLNSYKSLVLSSS